MKPLTFPTRDDLPPTSRSEGGMLWNRTGSWRFLRPRYQDKTAPCSEACPAGEDIARVELLVAQGAYEEAWRRIREENPFPGVCGRVCHHPCEASCNRGEYDDAVSINSLERFLADNARRRGFASAPAAAAPSGRTVAVVGAGPAGLAAAFFLSGLGHSVELFDARDEPGGLLRYAVPEYRLPVEVLAWEAGLVLSAGVRFHPGRRLGGDLGWEELARFDAVFVATGSWKPVALGVDGQEHAGDGLALLEAVRRGQRPELSGPVAVIGGGNTALDVARTVLRLGGEPVAYYRRRHEDMPALPAEREEAAEEGIRVEPLRSPSRLERRPDGSVALHLAGMEVLEGDEAGRVHVVPSGAPDVVVHVSAVFSAIGARPSEGTPAEATSSAGAEVAALHLRRLRPQGPWAGRPPVFVGGDLVNERRSVVTAIASGKEAAVVIDAQLRGRDLAAVWPRVRVGRKGAMSLNLLAGGDRACRQERVVRFADLNPIYFGYEERRERPRITPDERRSGFDEVRMRISASLAVREAERCFHCGLCDGCDNCYLFCPDVCVLRDGAGAPRSIDYDYCKGCGVCVVECPRSAMVLEEEPR